MKVNYPLVNAVEIKEIKEILKPFGGRCAKIVESTLEYQISEESREEAYQSLKEKGYIE
jgi:hypothetical protein